MIYLPIAAWADVEINETNFPDENFRSFISSDIDTDGDGILSTAEINVITRINVLNSFICFILMYMII